MSTFNSVSFNARVLSSKRECRPFTKGPARRIEKEHAGAYKNQPLFTSKHSTLLAAGVQRDLTRVQPLNRGEKEKRLKGGEKRGEEKRQRGEEGETKGWLNRGERKRDSSVQGERTDRHTSREGYNCQLACTMCMEIMCHDHYTVILHFRMGPKTR